MDNLYEVDHMPTLPLALVFKCCSKALKPELAPLCWMVRVGGIGKALPYPQAGTINLSLGRAGRSRAEPTGVADWPQSATRCIHGAATTLPALQLKAFA